MQTAQLKASRIALFGSTGKMGKEVLVQSLNKGYAVNVLVRDASKIAPSITKKLNIITGDVSSADDVKRTIEACDVVISCLGNVKGNRIMHRAFDNIIVSAKAQKKAPRCIFITTLGCGGTSWFIKRLLILIVGKKGIEDYERADRKVVNEDQVSCVLVRPSALNDRSKNTNYAISNRKRGHFFKSITRKAVARFLVSTIEDKTFDGSKGVIIGGAK